MSYTIILTARFKRGFKSISKKYKSLEKDVDGLVESLLINPVQGKPLGKDCYKIRLKIISKGKGKSGGGRIITCVKVLNEIIYFLLIYDKSNKEAIPDKELDDALQEADLL